MKKSFLSIIITAWALTAPAQSYQWAKSIGSTSGDYGYTIAVDKLKITTFAT